MFCNEAYFDDNFHMAVEEAFRDARSCKATKCTIRNVLDVIQDNCFSDFPLFPLGCLLVALDLPTRQWSESSVLILILSVTSSGLLTCTTLHELKWLNGYNLCVSNTFVCNLSQPVQQERWFVSAEYLLGNMALWLDLLCNVTIADKFMPQK